MFWSAFLLSFCFGVRKENTFPFRKDVEATKPSNHLLWEGKISSVFGSSFGDRDGSLLLLQVWQSLPLGQLKLSWHDQRGHFQGPVLGKSKTGFRGGKTHKKKAWLKVFPHGFGKDFNFH